MATFARTTFCTKIICFWVIWNLAILGYELRKISKIEGWKIKIDFSQKIIVFEVRNRLSVGKPYRSCRYWQQNQTRNPNFKIFTLDLEFFPSFYFTVFTFSYFIRLNLSNFPFRGYFVGSYVNGDIWDVDWGGWACGLRGFTFTLWPLCFESVHPVGNASSLEV